jgi:hypothetical protein
MANKPIQYFVYQGNAFNYIELPSHHSQNDTHQKKTNKNELTMVANTCNPSYLEGEIRRHIVGVQPGQNVHKTPISTNKKLGTMINACCHS